MKELDPTRPDEDPGEQIQAETPALPSGENLVFDLDDANMEALLDRYRRYRVARIYPDDACFFLICSTLEMIARQECLEEDFAPYRDAARREGNQGPPDGEHVRGDKASKAFTLHMSERYVEVMVDVFDRYDEREMAVLFSANPRLYRERRERGRLFFRGVSLPDGS